MSISMIERFFSTPATAGSGCGSHSDANAITLLSGPPSCGKTSLLFQYALNCAAEDPQSYVVFICDRRRFQAKPPYLSQGINPSSHLFHHIQIKYVEDDEAINKYFAAFHLLHPPPAALILDDFGHFFHQRNCQNRFSNPRGRDLAMVRALALSQSAIVHANHTAPCKLLLSDTHHGDAPTPLFLYKRWISSIFIVQPQPQGHGLASFLLKNTHYPKTTAQTKSTATYSIALHYLVFEGITQDSHPSSAIQNT